VTEGLAVNMFIGNMVTDHASAAGVAFVQRVEPSIPDSGTYRLANVDVNVRSAQMVNVGRPLFFDMQGPAASGNVTIRGITQIEVAPIKLMPQAFPGSLRQLNLHLSVGDGEKPTIKNAAIENGMYNTDFSGCSFDTRSGNDATVPSWDWNIEEIASVRRNIYFPVSGRGGIIGHVKRFDTKYDRQMLGNMTYGGGQPKSPVQGSVLHSPPRMALSIPGLATPQQIGLSMVPTAGIAHTPTNSTPYSSQHWTMLTTGTASGAKVDFRETTVPHQMGTDVFRRGYRAVFRFGLNNYAAGMISAVGVFNKDTDLVPTDIGVGGVNRAFVSMELLPGDANWFVAFSDAVTKARISLGAGFPARSGQDVYVLTIYARPGDSNLTFQCENLLTGANYMGARIAATDTMPNRGTLVGGHHYIDTQATGVAVSLAFAHYASSRPAQLDSRPDQRRNGVDCLAVLIRRDG